MLGKLYSAVLLVLSGFLIVVLQFGFIFMILALLPSFVAHFIDPDPAKPKFKVVFACNVAATLPTLVPMFEASLSFQSYDITTMISNANLWLFIYGGAASGWALIYLCTHMAYYIVAARNEFVIRQIEDQQRLLVEEWGTQVTDIPLPPRKTRGQMA